MDPVTIGAVVQATINGATSEAGSKLCDGLIALVRRPVRNSAGNAAERAELPNGQAELAALQSDPSNEGTATALAEALWTRTSADKAFQQDFEDWFEIASRTYRNYGNVANKISGGIQHGPIFQGREFRGLTFNADPQQRAAE